MAQVDIDKWLKDRDTVAIRIRSADLKDFLGLNIFSTGSVEVPVGTVGLAFNHRRDRSLLRPGQTVEEEFELSLVKDVPLMVPFSLAQLHSKDDYPFDVAFHLVLSVDCLSVDAVADFAVGLFGRRDAVTTGTLKRFLQNDVKEALKNFVSAEAAEDLIRGDRSADIEKAVRSALKRVFFENGFDLDDVTELRIQSESFETVRDERLGAVIEEERSKRREVIRKAWKKDQLNEVMNEKEVKEFVKALEHEGALKEIERRKEKAEAEKELWGLTQDKETEKFQAELQNASQVMEVLENAGFRNVFERFLEIADKRSSSLSAGDMRRAQSHGIRARRTHRLLAATGTRVLAFDPASPGQRPAEVFDLSKGSLGMIRSIRSDRVGEDTVLLAGAQYGVYVLRESEGFAPKALAIPGAGDLRGGVNAAVTAPDTVLATHSEYGIVSWPLDGGEGTFLRPDLTQNAPTVRGLRRGPSDSYFFAAGKKIFSFLNPALEGTPTVYEGADAAITALWVTRAAVFAGTKSGDLLRFSFGEPCSPRREIAKGVEPIFMIKTALLDLKPCLLVGWKGYGVLAKVLETDSQVQFLSDVRVRWVDGESDYVFGVDREGRRILVWKTTEKNTRHAEFITEERVQDIWVWPVGDEGGDTSLPSKNKVPGD